VKRLQKAFRQRQNGIGKENSMFEKTVEILKKLRGEDIEVTMETALVEDLSLDSIEVIGLITEFEEEFGIEIPERVIPSLRTVGDVVNYLEKNVK